MNNEQLKLELKGHIIKYLNLLEMTPADIVDDKPLFHEDMGLDSIDAIELTVMLEREYGIKITDPKEGRKVLVDVNTIVEYINEHRSK